MWFLAVPLSLALGLLLGYRLSRRSGAAAANPAECPPRESPDAISPAALGRVAHELRSPLAALASSLDIQERTLARGPAPTEVLRDGPAPGTDGSAFDTARRALATAQAARAQIAEIADELRAIGRVRGGQEAVVPVAALLDAALLLTADQLRAVDVERAGDLGLRVRGVPGQLVRVLVNLLVNASRALDGPGRVRMTAGATEGWIELRISDTGPGVAPGSEEQIFAEGYTCWPGAACGEGYGLALCREVARAHGGDLVLVDSELGGATFFLRLPAGEPGA